MSTTATQTSESTSSNIKLKAAFDTDGHSQYKYNDYLPVYDETTTFPPVEPFDVHHRGLDADKAKPNLLNSGQSNVEITRLTPRVGTEIKGLQLSQLSDAQKNELALLVAERGVVVFRDQDFKDIGPKKQKEFGEYFGRLHVHVSNSSSGEPVCLTNICVSLSELMLKTTSSFTISTLVQTTFTACNSARTNSQRLGTILTCLTSASRQL